MTVDFPEATPSLNNLSIVAMVGNVTTPASIPLATWTAGLNLTGYLRPFVPSASTNTGSAPDRLYQPLTLPQEGRTQLEAFALRYIYGPQEDSAADVNKAMTLLAPGSIITLGIRRGLDPVLDAAAAGQQIETWLVQMGKRQNRSTSGDDDFAEFEIEQQAIPKRDVIYGVLTA